MKNKDLKISLVFTLIGIIAGALLGALQVNTLSGEMKQLVTSQLGSATMLIPVAAAQTAVLTFVSSFFGLKLSRKVNLRLNFVYDKAGIIGAAVVAFISALLLSASDKFIFAQYLPAQTEAYKFSPMYFISSIIYGGIIEELMMRLFLMSLLTLILWKIFARSRDKVSIPYWIYVSAIFLAAILFGAGHLPATAQLLGLSAPIVIRAFLLNGAAGIGFGYLYWKKGLSYAIYAHMLTHVINQLIFMPLFFS